MLRTTKQDLQMLRTLLVGGAGALVLMTNPAVADGMPRGAPVASVVCCAPNWTGPYIGVGVGGAFATHDRSARDINELNGAVVNATRLWDDHHGRSHVFGTVTLGYDYQFSPRWVAGAFVDYDFGNKNDHTSPVFGELYRHPPVAKGRTRMVDRRQARRPIEPEHTPIRVSRLDSSFDRSRPFFRVRWD